MEEEECLHPDHRLVKSVRGVSDRKMSTMPSRSEKAKAHGGLRHEDATEDVQRALSPRRTWLRL